MANFERVRTAGFWTLASVVLPEEFELLDEHLSQTINGAEGSTHAPTSQIVIGGAGLYVTGDASFDAIVIATLKTGGMFKVVGSSELLVENDGLAVFEAGARADFKTASELRMESGSFVNVKVGASLDVHGATVIFGSMQVQSGGTVVAFAGSTITVNGVFWFASGTWPKLSPTRSWERHSLLICNLTYDSGDPEPARPDAWIRQSDLANAAACIQTRGVGSAGKYHWIELTDLPNGGTLSAVHVKTRGTSGSVALTMPTYKVVRWSGEGSTQDCSATVTDVHVMGNWFSGLLTTSIDITANATIDKTYRYALVVNHPYESGVMGAMRVYDVRYTGTVDEIRV